MDKKIFFDLDNVSSDLFIQKLESIELDLGISYSINLFIVPYNKEVVDCFSRRFPNRMFDSNLFLIKIIPFTLFQGEDKREKIKSLFFEIFISLSYTDVGFYNAGEVFYNKAFCIEINSDGFLL